MAQNNNYYNQGLDFDYNLWTDSQGKPGLLLYNCYINGFFCLFVFSYNREHHCWRIFCFIKSLKLIVLLYFISSAFTVHDGPLLPLPLHLRLTLFSPSSIQIRREILARSDITLSTRVITPRPFPVQSPGKNVVRHTFGPPYMIIPFWRVFFLQSVDFP